MAKQSLTSLSLKMLRDAGWTADICERWLRIPGSVRPTKKDAFGFADIVAVGSAGVLFVQVTSTGNQAARLKKLRVKATAREVIRSGAMIAVHGWRKDKDDAWTVTVTPVLGSMLHPPLT